METLEVKKGDAYNKLAEIENNHKVICSCGTKTLFYPFEHADKKICRGCHHYVFANKKAEFKFKLKERLMK